MYEFDEQTIEPVKVWVSRMSQGGFLYLKKTRKIVITYMDRSTSITVSDDVGGKIGDAIEQLLNKVHQEHEEKRQFSKAVQEEIKLHQALCQGQDRNKKHHKRYKKHRG